MKFMLAPVRHRLIRTVPFAAALALVLTAGCADLQRANFLAPDTINPASPVAEDARLASEAHFPYPNFRDVPPKPKTAVPAATYKTAVVATVEKRRQLTQWEKAHPPLTEGTEDWAVEQRGRIPKSAAEPVTSTQSAESEAFAEKLRREAEAPARPQ